MNVLAIGGEDGTAANETPRDRKSGLEDWQTEGNDWNCNRDNGGSFLRSLKSQSAQHEPDEQAAAVAKKNCRRIEVEAEKSQNGARKGNRHQGYQRRTAQQRNYKDDHGREQSGAGREAIQAIDEVESIRNGQHPQDGQRQSYEPREIVASEQYGQVENAKAAGKQHGRGQSLHRKLEVRPRAAQIVVNAEQKYQASGREQGPKGFGGCNQWQGLKSPVQQPCDGQADCKGNENRDPT